MRLTEASPLLLHTLSFLPSPSFSYRPHLRGFWWEAAGRWGCMHDRTSGSSIFYGASRDVFSKTIYLSHLFLSLMGLNQCSNRCPLCRRLCKFLGESMEEQNCPPRFSKPLWAEKTLLNVCRNGTMNAPRLACKAIVLIDNAIADPLTPATLS